MTLLTVELKLTLSEVRHVLYRFHLGVHEVARQPRPHRARLDAGEVHAPKIGEFRYLHKILLNYKVSCDQFIENYV